MEYDIIIIGGGPAGLMAACRASELGARVVLLEKNKQLQVFNKSAVDRELRMVELKENIKSLEEEIKRYKR